MKKLLLYVCCICLISSCENPTTSSVVTCGVEEISSSAPQNLNVLFIGTNHTIVYNVPETVKLIAESKGDVFNYEMSAPEWYDFKRHCQLNSTISEINSKSWDYVVMQESGWRTALPQFMADTMVYPYATTLNDMIKGNNNATKVVLYMTQGYRNGVLAFNDSSWAGQDPQVTTYEGMQERIRENYLYMTELLNSGIAPAGMMWNIFTDRYPDVDLYLPDGIHANQNGAYLSACTIYSVICKRKPENIYIPADVADDIAQKIQTTVSEALFDCNPDWREY